MKVDSMKKAWIEADRIFKGDYTWDGMLSSRAGYGIYTGTLGGWISDLGNRLEVNQQDGTTINIFVEEIWE